MWDYNPITDADSLDIISSNSIPSEISSDLILINLHLGTIPQCKDSFRDFWKWSFYY